MTATTPGSRQLAWDEEGDPDRRATIPHPIDDFGAGFDGEPQPYKLGPDLTRIAVAVIGAFEARLGHLRQFTLAYLWTDTLGKSQGQERPWRIVKPSRELKWALGFHEHEDVATAAALVEFSAAYARGAGLTWWELQGVVHAALRTIDVNDEGEPRIVAFDERLQAEIAAIYGTYSPFLKRLADALGNGADYQRRMDLEAMAAAKEAGKAEGRAEARAELRESLQGVLG